MASRYVEVYSTMATPWDVDHDVAVAIQHAAYRCIEAVQSGDYQPPHGIGSLLTEIPARFVLFGLRRYLAELGPHGPWADGNRRAAADDVIRIVNDRTRWPDILKAEKAIDRDVD